MSSIQINSIGTKGSHFKFETAFQDPDYPKLDSNRNSPAKESLHLVRFRVRRDIDVFGCCAPQRIPDASTGEVSDKTIRLELPDNRSCHGKWL
jgi:hypothetical protein